MILQSKISLRQGNLFDLFLPKSVCSFFFVFHLQVIWVVTCLRFVNSRAKK